ncbi:MAG: peptidoglycan DD-metalloendopeptidase family protein [Rhodocyclaceae bacterium]|jgi:lipoprotein NlpD|nr:peptidoglycan DD-metalloendopeptidase family protein [Rhodocyclaceae bacterium]
MNQRFAYLLLLAATGLAGCITTAPVPVADSGTPVRIEAPRATTAAPAGKFYTVKKGDTLYSIALDHGIEYRELAAWNNIDNPSRIRVGQQLRVASAEAAPAAPAGSAEVRAIETGGPVTARALDGSPAAVPPAPISASDRIKRAPVGGKLPYSEENVALLKNREAAPVAVQSPASVATTVVPAEKPPVAAAPAAAAAGEIDWAWPAGGKIIATFDEGSAPGVTKGIDIAGKIGDPVLAAAAGKVIYVGSGLRGMGNFVVVRHTPAYLSVYAHNSRILVKEEQAVTRGQKIAELGNSDADQPKLHFEVRHQGKPVDPLKYLPAR